MKSAFFDCFGVVTCPLAKNKGFKKDHGAQKPGNSPGPGSEIVERQRATKEQAAQRVRSWTVHNEMKSVLGRMSAGAAGRIVDSANPSKIRT